MRDRQGSRFRTAHQTKGACSMRFRAPVDRWLLSMTPKTSLRRGNCSKPGPPFARATTGLAAFRPRWRLPIRCSTNWLSGLFALEYSGLFGSDPVSGAHRNADPAWWHVKSFPPHSARKRRRMGSTQCHRGRRSGPCGFTPMAIEPESIKNAPRWRVHRSQLDVWIRQRTRWLKGWAQTWLVAMRRPMQHRFTALGPAGFCLFQLMIAGMLVVRIRAPADVCVHR
jgi:hypothetical protein